MLVVAVCALPTRAGTSFQSPCAPDAAPADLAPGAFVAPGLQLCGIAAFLKNLKLELGRKMRTDYQVADAAYASDMPESRIRSWVQRSLLQFGHKTGTQRLRFTESDILGLALMRELIRYGQSPNLAARQAKALLIKVGPSPPPGLSAVCSLDAAQSPMVVPTASVSAALGDVRVVIDISKLWASVAHRLTNLKGLK